MGDMRDTLKISARKLEGRDHFLYLLVERRIILKWILRFSWL